MRIYVYVDGESHFVRSQALWRRLHGDDAQLSEITTTLPRASSTAYPHSDEPSIRLEPRAKFFWDTHYQDIAPQPYTRLPIDGAAYFTSFSGDEDGYHAACVAVRAQRFDPQITRERVQLSDQRRNRLGNQGLLEKAKGVDIGLSVRVLEDAYHNIFDLCFLFTSDIDFLPVIRVVQRIGKKVLVFGYKDGLGTRSELEYVPDGFVDLAEYATKNYVRMSKPDNARG